MIYDIFVNCNWVATRWQQYCTHLHTNNTHNDKNKQYIEEYKNFGRVRVVPLLCGCPVYSNATLHSKLKKGLKTSLIYIGYCPSVPVWSPYSSRRHAANNKIGYCLGHVLCKHCFFVTVKKIILPVSPTVTSNLKPTTLFYLQLKASDYTKVFYKI
jgi:hypothetical protein